MEHSVFVMKVQNGYVITRGSPVPDDTSVVCNHFDSLITWLRQRFGEHRPVVIRPTIVTATDADADDKSPARGEPNE